jgi:phosphopantothenoylcysteine decarboxylase / phosphopantothenate---cysteine ligase
MENTKNIVIGVCGGIACYKVASLVSMLTREKINVDVIMTKNATEFITPLTFETLSKNKVYVDMFEKTINFDVKHISLAKKADLIVVVPATANILGKVANGIADDMLTTTIMACNSKVVFCPSMNDNMFNNKIVQNNIERLKSYGYIFIKPKVGNLACGTVGIGKLEDPKALFDQIMEILNKENNI